MGNNFNKPGSEYSSPTLNETHEKKLQNETSLRERHDLISKLDINPEFSWPLNAMLDDINASLFEIMECKNDILAANDEVFNTDNVSNLEYERKRPVFEELKAA